LGRRVRERGIEDRRLSAAGVFFLAEVGVRGKKS